MIIGDIYQEFMIPDNQSMLEAANPGDDILSYSCSTSVVLLRALHPLSQIDIR